MGVHWGNFCKSAIRMPAAFSASLIVGFASMTVRAAADCTLDGMTHGTFEIGDNRGTGGNFETQGYCATDRMIPVQIGTGYHVPFCTLWGHGPNRQISSKGSPGSIMAFIEDGSLLQVSLCAQKARLDAVLAEQTNRISKLEGQVSQLLGNLTTLTSSIDALSHRVDGLPTK
jgi:hypothetical protein